MNNAELFRAVQAELYVLFQAVVALGLGGLVG